MSVIYLKHEKHGAKVAMSDLEAAYDERNGWVRFVPDQPAVNELPPVDIPPAPTANAMPKRSRTIHRLKGPADDHSNGL